MSGDLLSFEDVVKLIAEKYGVPFEVVELILLEWGEWLSASLKRTQIPSSLISEEKTDGEK